MSCIQKEEEDEYWNNVRTTIDSFLCLLRAQMLLMLAAAFRPLVVSHYLFSIFLNPRIARSMDGTARAREQVSIKIVTHTR